MFFLTKVISNFFYPLTLFFLICTIGLVFYIFRKQVFALIAFIIAFSLLLFFSSDFGQTFLATPLEESITIVNPQDYPNIKTVVVLGSGCFEISDRSANSTLSNTSIVRLVEGIRIFNITNAQKLVFTGRNFINDVSIAAVMKQCAIDLGVEESRIITIDNARNTREEARHCADHFLGDTVFLVSSATHLRRAEINFNNEGIFVVPMPTDFQINKKTKTTILDFFPNPSRLINSDKSIHEYLGLLWEIIK